MKVKAFCLFVLGKMTDKDAHMQRSTLSLILKNKVNLYTSRKSLSIVSSYSDSCIKGGYGHPRKPRPSVYDREIMFEMAASKEDLDDLLEKLDVSTCNTTKPMTMG